MPQCQCPMSPSQANHADACNSYCKQEKPRFRADVSQLHMCSTTHNSESCFTWSAPGVLLSWTPVRLDCLVLLTSWLAGPLDMPLALDWLRPCPWLGASESASCKAMLTGEAECKGGLTYVAFCFGKQHWLVA